MKLIRDSFEPLIEQNCEMVQIAVYYDESILLVDESLWEQMNWTHRTGLLAHELIYSIERRNGSTNSISTRKFVGQLLSTKGARPLADGVPTAPESHAGCLVTNKGVFVGYFYAYDSTRVSTIGNDPEGQGLEFVFNSLENASPIFRTLAFITGLSMDALFAEKEFDGDNTRWAHFNTEGYGSQRQLALKLRGKGKATLVVADSNSRNISDEFDVLCSKN